MPNEGKEPYEVEDVKCVGETEAALKCLVGGHVKWVPKSVVHEDESEVTEEGDEGILVVDTWFAQKEGMD
jgi:hypothetical protein